MTLWQRYATAVRDWMGSWSSGDKALISILGGQGPAKSGVNVTEDTALNISAVWACTQLIAGNLASLPLIHYRRAANGDRERATDTKLYRLLHDEPNSEMSSASFLETLQQHVLIWGNAFAEILRDGNGRVVELYPIEPWRVSGVRQNGLAGPLRYRIAQRDGTDEVLAPEEILHIPGLSSNGVWGYSVIRKARESFGLTMATEAFGATFFGKGSTFGGILTHPGAMTPDNVEKLRNSLKDRHEGVDRAHQFIILQGGMTYTPVGIPGRDAQFLQQRQFQLSEIARWFGVPPHLIGDVEKSTSWGAGIQQQTIGFLQFTLRRWLVKWERELNRKLISPLERNLQFIEFQIDALERGDQESRYRAYATGIQWGFMTRNEVRGLENLPQIEGGDTPLVPANMTTEEKITAPEPKPVVAMPAAAPNEGDEEEPDEEDDRQVVADLETLKEIGRELIAQSKRIIPTPAGDESENDFMGRCMANETMQSEFPDDKQRAAVCHKQFADRAIQLEMSLLRDDVAKIAAAIPPPTPPTDLTPVLERLASVDEVKGRMAKLAGPLRGLLENAVRDFVKREADRARKAATSPEKLGEWMISFYPRQEDYAVKGLRDAVQLFSVLVDRPNGAETLIRAQAAQYIERSCAALDALVREPPADLKAAVEQLTRQWETERPAAFADALMAEVLHV
jgi:HK97 family phage portal protein